ncbi:ankyrin repeat [Stylonychia lemnae]|uniref:Ankyrin repeat n=1 Tax=Stylonychia lemnae TaxID=5949 RepID=A0A078AM03_STYLE|nr:ankyrin repeat [Stylonychia lemnae]|eukprot:CDW82442.1 ankyrin repeat [Stylonychia lemnae]
MFKGIKYIKLAPDTPDQGMLQKMNKQPPQSKNSFKEEIVDFSSAQRGRSVRIKNIEHGNQSILPHLKGSDTNIRFTDLKSIPEAAEMRNLPSQSNEDPTPKTMRQPKTHRRIANDLKQVELLLQSGYDLNVTDKYKRNLIHYIAIQGSAQMFQMVTEYLKYISGLLKQNFTDGQVSPAFSQDNKNFVNTEKLIQLSSEIEKCFVIESDVFRKIRKQGYNQAYSAMKDDPSNMNSIASEQQINSKDNAKLTARPHNHQFSNEFLRYKRSSESTGVLKHINSQDLRGLTPLHIAVLNRNLEIIIILVNNGANLFLEDGKRKIALDYINPAFQKDNTDKKMLALLLEKMISQECAYYEQQQLKKIRIDKNNRPMSQQELFQPQIQHKGNNLKLHLNEKILASFSNHLLEKFTFGFHSDNALLYCIRINNLEFFKYFVRRGVSLLVTEAQGNNTLHQCVMFDRLDFVRFLFQDYSQILETIEDADKMPISEQSSIILSSQAQIANKLQRNTEKYPWVNDALKCIDKATFNDGSTALHKVCQIGNIELLNFLIQIVRQREQFKPDLLKLKDVIEFTNNDNQTPLFVAAKYNNLNCVNFLFENGANLYAIDNKMENILHNAIHNENEELIKFLVKKDEKFLLRREKNIYDKIPIDLEKAQQFMTWLYTIWDAVEGGIINLVASYVKSKDYEVNQKRPGDQKTPLHLAIIGLKFDMIKILIQLGADPLIKDMTGQNAMDYLPQKNDQNIKNIRRLLNRKMSKAIWPSEIEGGGHINQNDFNYKISSDDQYRSVNSDNASNSNNQHQDVKSQYSIPKVQIIKSNESLSENQNIEEQERLLSNQGIGIDQLDKKEKLAISIPQQQDIPVIKEDQQESSPLRRSSSQINVDPEELLFTPSQKNRRKTQKQLTSKFKKSSPSSRRGSTNSNLFALIDVLNNGFVSSEQFLEQLKAQRHDFEGRVKLSLMIQHVDESMKNCIITDEVFKTLLRQFAKIQP